MFSTIIWACAIVLGGICSGVGFELFRQDQKLSGGLLFVGGIVPALLTIGWLL